MKYDIIIIGTGAGGGTLLYQLAPSGKRILVLERGDFLPKEKENWDPLAVAKGRYKTTELWRDGHGNSFSPYQHYWVGGNTKLYGGALLRLRERDFQEVRHFDGISPAWPVSYHDFAPWYDRAERLYAVHGQRGIDPTEPPMAGEYPFPPLPYEPRMAQVADAIRRQGYNPAPIPLAVRLPEDQNGQQADKLNIEYYDGYPDPTGAKAESHVISVMDALRYPNVTLLRNRQALKLQTNESGTRVTGVEVVHEGIHEYYEADLIAVCCGAINSAALLLRSAGDKHPNGLANSSGLVGRNLMIHNNGIVLAYSATPNPSTFQKAIIIADFYHGAEDSPYPLGSIQNMGKADPLLLADAVGADLGKNGKDEAHFAGHIIDYFITAEDLPLHDNRVTVDLDGVMRITYRQNNLEAYQRLRDKLIQIMDRVAASEGVGGSTRYYGFKLGAGGVTHQSGTCRFGIDPKTAVLDLNCKAHDLENLYVVDTSFFPSSGAVNPSLTAMANALRVGDYLRKL
ncbi:MAG: GMC family oxidoreductase [Saprospiraceae bacterium]|nr:GMC family oxidoreductase [Saprospiraceae bacterium]